MHKRTGIHRPPRLQGFNFTILDQIHSPYDNSPFVYTQIENQTNNPDNL